MKKDKNKKSLRFKKFGSLIFIIHVLVLILALFLPKYKKRLKKIFKEEKREVKELIRKEESPMRFCRDSFKIFLIALGGVNKLPRLFVARRGRPSARFKQRHDFIFFNTLTGKHPGAPAILN